MSDEALREVNRTIVEMSRAIGALESTVKTLTTTWQSQEVSVAQGRRDLHRKFDGLASRSASWLEKST